MRSERGAALATLLALLASCSPPSAQGESKPQAITLTKPKMRDDVGTRALRHVETMVGFGERYTGTPGWKSNTEWIARKLTQLGLEVERDRWRDPKEGVEFENIVGRVRGRSKERIVFAAHHDTKRCSGHDDASRNFTFLGANDSGSGCGLLLALAENLVKRDNAATLEFVFFDGEESMTWEWNAGARALFGSKRFAARERELVVGTPKPKIAAFVLLDMVGAKDLQIDDETNSDAELRRIFLAAAQACGHAEVFFKKQHAVSDDHLPFVEAGVRSIDLVDLYDNPEWHTASDVYERLSDRSLQIVGEVVLTALPELERRYVAGAASRPAEKR